MNQQSRRDFLKDVGKGVVVASVGSGLAADLGFSPAFAEQGTERLTFGTLEPLVTLMQETPAARLMPLLGSDWQYIGVVRAPPTPATRAQGPAVTNPRSCSARAR